MAFISVLAPYYYFGRCRDSFGGKFRLELRLFEYVTLEGIASYDKLFKGTVQGVIRVVFPKRECKKGLMTQPIYRDEIIALDCRKFCKWWKNY